LHFKPTEGPDAKIIADQQEHGLGAHLSEHVETPPPETRSGLDVFGRISPRLKSEQLMANEATAGLATL